MREKFLKDLGTQYPIICGPMFPCSNPELVAAASEAGAMGIVQPLTYTYINGLDFREGMKKTRELTSKPLGMNALIEASSQTYHKRMENYVEIALEEGVRFFITSLGNPKWVVEKVKPHGGVVYHDVINRKFAEKGLAGGVDGLIAVNSRAGGHAGPTDPKKLYEELKPLNVPIVCAGGIGNADQVREALAIGYAGVQLGTRFIASKECTAHEDYKRAIVEAHEKDIVLTERVSGVPLSVIRTPHIEKMGLKASAFEKWMLKGRTRKKVIRSYYMLSSALKLKGALFRKISPKDILQAGKSVENIHDIPSVGEIVQNLAKGLGN